MTWRCNCLKKIVKLHKFEIPHRSQNRSLCHIKCSRKLRLLNLSQFLCWFWISNQFLNICSGLQLRPPRSFIGFLRRKTPFKIQSTDFDSYNSRTLSGMPMGAWGYPDTQIWHIWDFMINLKVPKTKNSQIGDFWIL